MIVCSCNVLSDARIRDALSHPVCPRTPGAVYKCLGCKTSCGRCLETIKTIITESMAEREPPLTLKREPPKVACHAGAV